MKVCILSVRIIANFHVEQEKKQYIYNTQITTNNKK